MKALLISSSTLYCGLFYLTNATNDQFQLLLFSLIFAGNLYFLVYWIYYIGLSFIGVIVKYSPQLRYFLKKGDDFDEEFFQEELSRPGIYFDKNEGDYLYTFKKISAKKKKITDCGVVSIDDLYCKAIEDEYKTFQKLRNQVYIEEKHLPDIEEDPVNEDFER